MKEYTAEELSKLNKEQIISMSVEERRYYDSKYLDLLGNRLIELDNIERRNRLKLLDKIKP